MPERCPVRRRENPARSSLRFKVALALALLLLWTPACSTSPVQPGATPVIIPDVPFFSQEAYQCGPTALATVIDYWHTKTGAGIWVTPEEIASAIYSSTARGVLGIDLEMYAQKHGFGTEQYSGDLDDLKKWVDLGTPPIIFVDYGLLSYEVNHFMVVTGYTKDAVIVNSGRHRNEAVPAGQLEKIWRKNRHWTLLLKPSS